MFIRILNRLWPVAALLVVCVGAGAGTTAKIVDFPPIKGGNLHYVGNRSPLVAKPLAKLPPGSIRPDGWLRNQLQMLADGWFGNMQELSADCDFTKSAWTKPNGEGDMAWENLPYWLKGYISLGYALDDKKIIEESREWVEAVMKTQQPDGYFGTAINKQRLDLWPNMPMMYVLRTYYEATNDKRVLDLLSKYFKWQTTIPLHQLLPASWQKARGGENLGSIYWLYNRTGEKWLLDLASVIHDRTEDWDGGIANYHGVNFTQCFREPAEYFQQCGDKRYLRVAEYNYDSMMAAFGQVPGGGFGADEIARLGYYGPRQGFEACSMVEYMHSDEILLSITGNPAWADRCEDVAFNTFPAAVTPDLRGLRYFTAPNMPQSDKQNKNPMYFNAGEYTSYRAGYPCCMHNIGFGWPYFAEHLWMVTNDNGLAAALYAANTVKAKVGKGIEVKIQETTDYPFDDKIDLHISLAKPAAFPLYLRIPGWCKSPSVNLNGKEISMPAETKGWIVLDRKWDNNDKVTITLPMDVRLRVWERNRNTVSVDRGPLTYSLKIGEDWRKFGDNEKWPFYEVFPTTSWNYGLLLDSNLTASFEVVKRSRKLARQPFTPENAPVMIRAKGKRIPQWALESNGLVMEVQGSPVISDQPIEDIELIPMGCARLRISAFPQVGDGPDARAWRECSTTASASFFTHDAPIAMIDEIVPSNSSDVSIPRFTWWNRCGSREWVQLTFGKPQRISQCEVYWYDDEIYCGSCRLPASWRVLWLDGETWKPVEGASEYSLAKDQFNKVTFQPVQTTALRVEVQLKQGHSAGVLEWRVGE